MASVVAIWASGAIGGVSAQVVANPVLNGRALLGDSVLTRGTVLLHHLSNTIQGEVDSSAVAPDGSFSLRLPNVPDPDRGDVFFASIRHVGVTYFGTIVTTASQLDSVYSIQTYDTLVAPEQGVDLQVEIRTMFFEALDDRWRVTDVFQLLNDRARTVVGRDFGAVWRYPLAAGAADFTVGESDVSPEVIELENGELVLRAPMSPGSRMFVVRYTLDDMFTAIPTPGLVDQFDLLIREPAPLIDVEGLGFLERTELEVGSTYRRYSGASLDRSSVRLVATETPFQPPVKWVAVVLAVLLAAMGLFALRGGRTVLATSPGEPRGAGRHDLLVEIARLDEAFESRTGVGDAERARYEGRRAELLRRIREAL